MSKLPTPHMPRPLANSAKKAVGRAAAAMKYKGHGIPQTDPGSDDPANNGPISPAGNMVQDKPSPGLLG